MATNPTTDDALDVGLVDLLYAVRDELVKILGTTPKPNTRTPLVVIDGELADPPAPD